MAANRTSGAAPAPSSHLQVQGADEHADQSRRMLFKILVVGDSSVGKSNILLQYSEGLFVENSSATIGVDFKMHELTLEGRDVLLQIWDTAGQDRFRAVVSTFFRNAHCVVLVYDITNSESLVNLSRSWMKDVRAYAPENVYLAVVGNKVDLESKHSIGAMFLETSAKANTNISELFDAVAHYLYREEKLKPTIKPTIPETHADPSGPCAC